MKKLLFFTLIIFASCGKIDTTYKQGEFPLLEYRVATDTTLDTVHCVRWNDYDYMIKNKRVVAKYDNRDKINKVGVIIVCVIFFAIGMYVTALVKS